MMEDFYYNETLRIPVKVNTISLEELQKNIYEVFDRFSQDGPLERIMSRGDFEKAIVSLISVV